jgi:coproporphyrinogen III oxidase-like Fe-S oxidoreductase
MLEDDKKRRNSLLCTLAFAGGHGVVRLLRDELEKVHGIAVTQDKLRADLAVLADVGAVRTDGDLVQITAEGREHAQSLRALF